MTRAADATCEPAVLLKGFTHLMRVGRSCSREVSSALTLAYAMQAPTSRLVEVLTAHDLSFSVTSSACKIGVHGRALQQCLPGPEVLWN